MPQSPRVLRIITRLNIGGPSLQAARLTTDLRARGYETWLVHGRVGPSEGDMRDLVRGDPAVIHIDTLQRAVAPLSDARAFAAILALIRRVQPDIVHTHMAKAGLLGRAAAAWYARTTGRRVHVLHTYHGHVLEGYFHPFVSNLVLRAERWLGRHSDRLIAISPRIADELSERYRVAPRDRFTIVPLGFDLSPFAAVNEQSRAAARRQLQIPDGAVAIGTVGRLTAIKNHELFLDAARAVAARRPDAVFLLAGDGELRTPLEAQARALGLADRIRFLGWRRDLADVYGALDVFVLTSRNEGTPVALIEAMAAGVAGVATDVGGVRDVLVDPSCGTLVPLDDVGRLAGAILSFADDPERRRRAGERARASVVERYAAARLVDDIDRVYRGLDAAPPAVPV